MCTGAEAAAVASTAKELAGEKQLGETAPSPNIGGPTNSPLVNSLGGGALGLLGNLDKAGLGGALSTLASQNNFGQSAPTETGNPAGVAPQGPDLTGGQFDDVLNAEITDPSEIVAREKTPNFFDRFFSGIDQDLQSPAKLIGMGLLNRRNPGLGTGLLAAKGLFDAFRNK